MKDQISILGKPGVLMRWQKEESGSLSLAFPFIQILEGRAFVT